MVLLWKMMVVVVNLVMKEMIDPEGPRVLVFAWEVFVIMPQ